MVGYAGRSTKVSIRSSISVGREKNSSHSGAKSATSGLAPQERQARQGLETLNLC